jgi:hypothetical protein
MHLFSEENSCTSALCLLMIYSFMCASHVFHNYGDYTRPYSKSSLALTLNEWRFNLNFSPVSLLFLLLLNSCATIALVIFNHIDRFYAPNFYST